MPNLPTLYEYYAPNGTITSGLETNSSNFKLNHKEIFIQSGTMHYFRIPRLYWRDRLRKLRAAGLNTVETYVPWNLHEPQSNQFDFGGGGSEMAAFLDLNEYLKIAQEEDLFAIVRPGPFICAEWDWGGLPSWLLREEGIQVRTHDSKFMKYVKRYFSVLLPLLATLQFMNGGPIIAFQVENEYANSPIIDKLYLNELLDIFHQNGIVELLVTSDDAKLGQVGTIPGKLFQTINFGDKPKSNLRHLHRMQPGQPAMVMELWSGGYDHWGEARNIKTNETFQHLYATTFLYGASINLYMFHGGTNFRFMNGADQKLPNTENNLYFQPTTTSYDYNAPLSEAGDYTAKYDFIREFLAENSRIKFATPEKPALVPRTVYPTLLLDGQLRYEQLRDMLPITLQSPVPLPMEHLPINNNSGQSYGYVVYETTLDVPANATLQILDHVRDTVIILINNKLMSPPLKTAADLNAFGCYRLANSSLTLPDQNLTQATLTIIVENWGRVNYGAIYHQKKGLVRENTLSLNGQTVEGPWNIYPVEFRKNWVVNLAGWCNVSDKLENGPALYRATLFVERARDTFVNMEGWTKGVVIVNGFVIGRYSMIGPQKSLYLPAPFLKLGNNEIVVFEHYAAGKQIGFSKDLLFYDN